MKIAKFVLPVIAAGFASTAMGAISLVNLEGAQEVDNTAGGAALVGYVTSNIVVNTTADWTAAAMLVQLTSGSIYQDAFGDMTGLAPNAVFLPMFPSLRYDSFVTNPDGTETGGGAAIVGMAADLWYPPPAELPQEFSTARISIAWNSPGADTNDIGDNMIARLSLSNTANGYLSLGVTEAGNPTKAMFLEVPIVNGHIVPEPASLGLLGLGGLALLRRR